jgi:uncharacterized circularly permuted ATP-grasp superfamily protein
MRDEAIAEYHRLLFSDETLNAELFARLKERMHAKLLSYGDRVLGISLRPHLLTREQYERLAYASEKLVAAFNKVAAAMLAQPAVMERVGLLEMERRLALVNPGFSHPAINTRLDAFVHGTEVKFVEFNAENPSSLTDQAGLNEVLSEIRALQVLAERYRLHEFDPAKALLQTLLETYREWAGRDAVPQIAILDWSDLPTANEFILLRDYFAAHGVSTIICTPDDLEYTGGKLRCGEFGIDLVYKRIIIHEYLARYDETHALARAYINGDVCLVNPFRCKMLHKKACFELLTDESCANWFTTAEREVIQNCVPWTRRVVETSTQYRGHEIDLVEHIRKHRSDFIIKPNDDYGGHGIFLGHQSTAAEWDAALSTALAGDYVVQEILELHAEEFPIFTEDQWSIQPMFVDTNPFIFRGRVEGALVRLSDSPIVNVTSGGGETGFFVIEGKANS